MIERWTSLVAGALQRARVARLGTVGGDGMIRLVPICFAVVDGWVASAVDHRPKRTGQLRRLDDIEPHVGDCPRRPRRRGLVAAVVDTLRGRAEVHREHGEAAVAVLAARKPIHAVSPTPACGAVYRIAIDDIRSWRPPGNE